MIKADATAGSRRAGAAAQDKAGREWQEVACSGEEADEACDEEGMLGGAEELESEGDEGEEEEESEEEGSEEEEGEEEGSEEEEEQEEDADVDALPEGCQPPSQVSMDK